VQKPMVKAALAGVLIVVAIVAVCVSTKAGGPKKLKRVERFLMCSRPQCAAISAKQVRINDKPPFECPKCSHQSAYLLVVCEKCGAYVPMTKPVLEDNHCPSCGGHAFTPPRFNPLQPPPEGAETGQGSRP